MVEGRQGLREWKQAVHIFLSDDREAAFQQALLIGRRDEDYHEEGRRLVESRLAEVVRTKGCVMDGSNSALSSTDCKKQIKEPLAKF